MTTLTTTPRRAARALAVLEVLVVLFLTMWAAFGLGSLGRVWGPLWENLSAHAAFIAVPVLWLILTGRDLEAYGLSLRRWRADWRWAMSLYLPVALGSAVLGFVDYRSWAGALVLVGVQLGVLVWVARRWGGQPDPNAGYAMILISSLALGAFTLWRSSFPGLGFASLALVNYVGFVGVGEEVLYRGFIQSRLEGAFGTPYRNLGVAWGFGLLLAALVFGLTHTGLFGLVFSGTPPSSLTWPWGLWTCFGGLVFGFVRSRTGSVIAPAILHGLPQAIAVALLGP